jgi:hypothetical protein
MIETGSSKSTKDVLPLAEKNGWMKKNKYSVTDISPWYSQQLSHQFIRARFLSVRLQQKTTINSEFRWVKKNELSQYAFPKVIKSYIEGGK